MMDDYMATIVNDHMVILCQHYMGTYFNVIQITLRRWGYHVTRGPSDTWV